MRLQAYVCVAALVSVRAAAMPKVNCQPRLACSAEGNFSRPVCGDDNQTYRNMCHLMRLQCEGVAVALEHEGPCKETNCLLSRRYAQKMRRLSRGGSFVPKCRRDGSYAPVQCHEDNNCWCVTPQGQHVPNTEVQNGQPNCGQREKSSTRRRSSTRRQKNNKEECSRADKSEFNSNLIIVFGREYDRENPTPTAPSNEKDKLVVERKFNLTDKNGNGLLEKKEYSQLLKIIRKVVKPKKCAKAFAKLCDLDRDEVITRQEWLNCITDNGHNYEGVPRPLGTNKGFGASGDILIDDIDDDNDDAEEQGANSTGGKRAGNRPRHHRPKYKIQKTKPALLLQGSFTKVSGQLPGYNDDSMDRNKDDGDSNDCFLDRKSALDDQNNGDEILYIPECMPDGRYKRMQCYRNTGYCWCVHEDTGKNIPGTSLKDKHPDCDLLPTQNRPMKGCPEQKKITFLRDLMEFLKKEMIVSTNGSRIMSSADSPKWQASKEEQIATWSFLMLDQNLNKVLERKEWKNFRLLVMDKPPLRRCGKKLPKYCDVNYDRKISLTEWLNCLNAQRGFSNPETTSVKTSTFPKRRGPNPLESYLKGD